jgi:predicted transcriptional regulator
MSNPGDRLEQIRMQLAAFEASKQPFEIHASTDLIEAVQYQATEEGVTLEAVAQRGLDRLFAQDSEPSLARHRHEAEKNIGSNTKSITVRLSPDYRKRLEQLAADFETTTSALGRSALLGEIVHGASKVNLQEEVDKVIQARRTRANMGRRKYPRRR